MTVELTKKQFMSLITAVEAGSAIYGILGDIVSDRYKKQSNNIEEVRNCLLAQAKKLGCKDIVEEFEGITILDEELAEKFDRAIEDYDDETFWHELETRLGKRDFDRSVTVEEIQEMISSHGLYPERIHDLYDNWGKEFEKHGIDRLGVVTPPSLEKKK